MAGMTDRAAYVLGAAIVVAGALVAGAIATRPVVNRYAHSGQALLETTTGELLVGSDSPIPEYERRTWWRLAAPVAPPVEPSE